MKWNHSVPWEITIEAPWPPSVNRYWRAWRNRMIVSGEGKEYKAHMKKHLLKQLDVRDLPLFPKPMRLECSIQAFPPDKRGRDVDNIQKVLLDSLTGIIWKTMSRSTRSVQRRSMPKEIRITASSRSRRWNETRNQDPE